RTGEGRVLAIVARRGLGRDVAVDDVVSEPRWIALPGRAVTAGAGRPQRDDGPGRRRETALARQLALHTIGGGHRHAARTARAAAEEPERRRLGALEAHARLGRSSQHAPDALGAATAAVPARPPAIGEQLVALDSHGKAHLEDLDRCIHRVRDAARLPVDAVLGRAGAEAALDRLVAHVAAPGPV